MTSSFLGGTAIPVPLSVTLPSFGITKHVSIEGLVVGDWKINIESFVIFYQTNKQNKQTKQAN